MPPPPPPFRNLIPRPNTFRGPVPDEAGPAPAEPTTDDAMDDTLADDEDDTGTEWVEVPHERRMYELAQLALARGEPLPALWVAPSDTLLNPLGPGSATHSSAAPTSMALTSVAPTGMAPPGMGSSIPGPVNQRKRRTPPADTEPRHTHPMTPGRHITIRDPVTGQHTNVQDPVVRQREQQVIHLRELAGLRVEQRLNIIGETLPNPWMEVEAELRTIGLNASDYNEESWEFYGSMVQLHPRAPAAVSSSGDKNKGKAPAERTGDDSNTQPAATAAPSDPYAIHGDFQNIFRPQAPAGLGDQTLGSVAGGVYDPVPPGYRPVRPAADEAHDAGRHIDPLAGPRPDMTPVQWELWLRDMEVEQEARENPPADDPSGPGEGSSKRRRRQ